MKALFVFLAAVLVLISAALSAQEVVEVGGSGTSTGTMGGSGGIIAVPQGAFDFVVPITLAVKVWGPGEEFRVFGVAVSALYEDVRVDRVVISQSIEADDWTDDRPFSTFERYRLYADGTLVGEVSSSALFVYPKETGYVVGGCLIIFNIDPDKIIWIDENQIVNLELHVVLNRDSQMIAEGSKHQFYLHPDPIGDGKGAVSGVGASSATIISGPKETLYGPGVVVSSGGDVYVGPEIVISDTSVIRSDSPQDIRILLRLVEGAVFGGIIVVSGQYEGSYGEDEGVPGSLNTSASFAYEPRAGMASEVNTKSDKFDIITFGNPAVSDSLGSLFIKQVPSWVEVVHIRWEYSLNVALNAEEGYTTDITRVESVINILPPFPPISIQVEQSEICMGDTVRIYIEGGESPFSVSVLSSMDYSGLYTAIPGQSDREWLLVPVEGWIEKWSVEHWPNDDVQGPVYVMVSDMYYSETGKVIVKPRLGDVSGNGAITPYDASLVARALLDLVEFSEYQEVAADFDQISSRWGRVDIWDCINILRYTVGLPIIVHDVAAAKPSADILEDALRILDDSGLSGADAEPIREVLNRAIGESEGGGDVLPKEFELQQNYPNPFNPETAIGYDVAVSGNVSVVVYDALGRQVATVASGYHTAGKYQAVWNASGVGVGVYFCSMEADGFRSVRKMLLLK